MSKETDVDEESQQVPDADDGNHDDAGNDSTVADAADVVEDDQDPEDVSEETVDLSEDEVGGSGLWDDVEDDQDDDSETDESDESADDQGDGLSEIADGLEGNAGQMEHAVNSGVGRLLVTGLQDEDFPEESNLDKSSLETELAETAEAFRLGYFATEVIETYVLDPADGDVSPTWGLLGAALMMCGMAVWLRPDGGQAVKKARETVGNITDGGLA